MLAFICSISCRRSPRSRAMDCNSCADSGDGAALATACRVGSDVVHCALGCRWRRRRRRHRGCLDGRRGRWLVGRRGFRRRQQRQDKGRHPFRDNLSDSIAVDCQNTAAPAMHAVKVMPITPRISRRPNDDRVLTLTLSAEATRKAVSSGGTITLAAASACLRGSGRDRSCHQARFLKGHYPRASPRLRARALGYTLGSICVGFGVELIGALSSMSIIIRTRARLRIYACVNGVLPSAQTPS